MPAQRMGVVGALAFVGGATHAFNRLRTVSICSFSEAPTPMRILRSSFEVASLQPEARGCNIELSCHVEQPRPAWMAECMEPTHEKLRRLPTCHG